MTTKDIKISSKNAGSKRKAPPIAESLSKELKAFLYQQIQEFEPYFLPDSNIGIAVNQDAESKEFLVTLVLSGGGSSIESQGKNTDVYQATMNAKVELLHRLQDIENDLISDSDREMGITQMMGSSPYLH